MSYTEITGFAGKEVYSIAEIKNAFRGAMAIWRIMEERYLPSLTKPLWMGRDNNDYYSRTSSFVGDSERNPMQDIWDLANNKELPDCDRIVMATTFDNVLVKSENIQKIIDAFRSFKGDTSLNEQADTIEDALKQNKDLIAIGWNQTSVCQNKWDGEYDEELDDYIPYDIKNGESHWFLFDEYEYSNIKE